MNPLGTPLPQRDANYGFLLPWLIFIVVLNLAFVAFVISKYISKVILVNCPACTRCPVALETTAQALPIATRALGMAARAYPDAASDVEVGPRAALGLRLK